MVVRSPARTTIVGQYQTGPLPAGRRRVPSGATCAAENPRIQPLAPGRNHVAVPEAPSEPKGRTMLRSGTS